MAIIEMRRVSLLGMQDDREKLLRVLQRFGCVHVTEVEDAGRYSAGAQAENVGALEELGRVRWTIEQLGRYNTVKAGFLASLGMPEVTGDEAERVQQHQQALMDVVMETEACERRSGELKGQEARLRARRDQLLPWRQMDLPVERIHETRDTVQFIGTVGNRDLDALDASFSQLAATLERVGEERDQVFVWAIAHRDEARAAQDALLAADFQAVHFTGERGTVAQLLDALRGEEQTLQAERDALDARMRELAQNVPDLKVLHDIIASTAERERVVQRFAVTGSTFLMEGWAPVTAVEKLTSRIHSVAPDAALSFREATEDEKPPTMLKNPALTAPFESIVTAYSYPDPRGFDPTTIMAPFFACLFGMMLSDGGYGLLMALAIPAIIHFAKPKPGTEKMLKVLFWGGVFTVLWGFIFNTWFGSNPSFLPTIIDTLNEPIPMLMVCLAMGAIHLFAGVGVAAYINIRRGKPWAAFFDQGLWVIMLFGIAFLLVPSLAGIGKWMAIGGAVGIVLTNGRDKPKLLGKLMSGAGALYGVSSWLSDLLSYMRLFGMGLATGVIGMVINMLVGLIIGKGIFGLLFGVVVLAGGHVFNFAINALGAYVHSCRLQYIEFFSKFYEDGGIPFSPLADSPHYVAIRHRAADGAEG